MFRNEGAHSLLICFELFYFVTVDEKLCPEKKKDRTAKD